MCDKYIPPKLDFEKYITNSEIVNIHRLGTYTLGRLTPNTKEKKTVPSLLYFMIIPKIFPLQPEPRASYSFFFKYKQH